MKNPIYIPSCGRPATATTPRLLEQCGLPFTLAVEPQEAEAYRRSFPTAKILVLSKSRAGLSFVRRAIQNESEQNGETNHWQLDDNIKSFRVRENKKNIIVPAIEVLSGVEKYVSQYDNIGIAGPAYAVFAWTRKNDVDINRQVSSAMLIKNGTGCYFRDEVSGVEDTDFCMQTLTKGLCTALFNRLLIEEAATGMKGGCTDVDYANNGRAKACVKLVDRWPSCFKIKAKNAARIAPSPVWRSFAQRPQRPAQKVTALPAGWLEQLEFSLIA